MDTSIGTETFDSDINDFCMDTSRGTETFDSGINDFCMNTSRGTETFDSGINPNSDIWGKGLRVNPQIERYGDQCRLVKN